MDNRLEDEASILNEEAEAIAREQDTCNMGVLIPSSPADNPPADESCEVVSSASGSPNNDLSDDEMCIVDAATIDDLSVEVTNLNRKVFKIHVTNFLVTY